MHRSSTIHQLRHCARRQSPLQGKKLHAQIVKNGQDKCAPPIYSNGLIDMYGKCHLLKDARQVFDEMPQRDLASWASLFTAHNLAGLPLSTLSIFPNMSRLDGFQPDHFVFASLVKACADLSALRVGKQAHGQFIVSPFSHDDVVKSSLVDMYTKCGALGHARKVFDSIFHRNPISSAAMISGYARNGMKPEAMELFRSSQVKTISTWTALISGMVQSGEFFDAFSLFIEMRKEGVDISDPYVLSSIIGASSSLAALDLGKQIHCLVIIFGYKPNLFVSNSLVDMYSKCSDVLASKTVFDDMAIRDVVSWTSIIVGMAQHGKANDALSLYDEMVSEGFKPNEVTFTGLISACSHYGLVERGRGLFKSMTEDYSLNPSLQHYTCLLDLLSRSGLLDEAENLLETMPFEPDEAAWVALLSACKRHGAAEMGMRVANRVMSVGPTEASTCVLLSSVYAGAGMWGNVSKLRGLMASLEVKKEPAYSCVGLSGECDVKSSCV
ncbi:hypothetical protein DM860_013390 [Cuscuta australis]|uniref:Pentacotripeptide-repeat region of PRORP domain-containing protein n=1 Tax=Cuscuta australis TaxID=267555 RepID=A0A328DP25_9ASTE|nr:hypothetical protein DM860_013390 [Cuscuta australis]